jgi:DNA-binding Xre family transcriptional regulator
MSKPLHLFKTTRSNLLVNSIADFETLKKQVICSILNCRLEDLTNINDDGLEIEERQKWKLLQSRILLFL